MVGKMAKSFGYLSLMSLTSMCCEGHEYKRTFLRGYICLLSTLWKNACHGLKNALLEWQVFDTVHVFLH